MSHEHDKIPPSSMLYPARPFLHWKLNQVLISDYKTLRYQMSNNWSEISGESRDINAGVAVN